MRKQKAQVGPGEGAWKKNASQLRNKFCRFGFLLAVCCYFWKSFRIFFFEEVKTSHIFVVNP